MEVEGVRDQRSIGECYLPQIGLAWHEELQDVDDALRRELVDSGIK